jgi:hypothetical protein
MFDLYTLRDFWDQHVKLLNHRAAIQQGDSILSTVFKLIASSARSAHAHCVQWKWDFIVCIAIQLWNCVILCFERARLNFRVCSRCFVFLVRISEDSVRRRRDVLREYRILQGSVGPEGPVDTGRWGHRVASKTLGFDCPLCSIVIQNDAVVSFSCAENFQCRILVTFMYYSFIHLFSILSDDRSKASSRTVPPHSAI